MSNEGAGGLVQFASAPEPEVELVGPEKAFEEAMFLGLRMKEGVDLEALRAEFGGSRSGVKLRLWGMRRKRGWWNGIEVGCG